MTSQASLRGNFKFIDGSVACDLPMNRMSELFNINTYFVSQVNPHVAPFINSDGIQLHESRFSRYMFTKFKNLFTNEFSHIINQLTELGIFPTYIHGLKELVFQSYRGHVTIAPRLTLYDYSRLCTNVEPSDFYRVLQHTYSQTVQRIGHIRALYGIEREFDRYYMRLKAKMNCKMHFKNDRDLLKIGIKDHLAVQKKANLLENVFTQPENKHDKLLLKLEPEPFNPPHLDEQTDYSTVNPFELGLINDPTFSEEPI